jgi:hypothetical protein
MNSQLKEFVDRELKHAEKFPHPPVAGCVSVDFVVGELKHKPAVNVLPILTTDALTLQFNGWALELKSDHTWNLLDTEKQASVAVAVDP